MFFNCIIMQKISQAININRKWLEISVFYDKDVTLFIIHIVDDLSVCVCVCLSVCSSIDGNAEESWRGERGDRAKREVMKRRMRQGRNEYESGILRSPGGRRWQLADTERKIACIGYTPQWAAKLASAAIAAVWHSEECIAACGVSRAVCYCAYLHWATTAV